MMNPLADIRQYAPRMTISQVMKFCEKKSIGITRAMIQNYVRIGLMPPPADKRFYTHKHLTLMVLIDRLKTVFEIPEIKKALAPFVDEDGLSPEIYEKIWHEAEVFAHSAEIGSNPLVAMTGLAAMKLSVQSQL